MHHFFVEKQNIISDSVYISGDDYNHAVNVLRLKKGEKVMVSTDGNDRICVVEEKARMDGTDCLRLRFTEELPEEHELPGEVVLFQCLPKAEKMELIIQKATELGAAGIVPVMSKNCVVKLDEKKAAAKQKRWQAIAESAAKQSMRSVIPYVSEPMSFKEAIKLMESFDTALIPYENENSISSMCESIINFLPERRIAVLIGPEGGFDKLEVSMAERHGIKPVSLGKRILRTETAAIAMLSLIMIRLEIAAGMDLGDI